MKSLISLSLILLLTFSLNAQVGIGTTTPEAALDITSTTDGFLIPRVALVSISSTSPLLITPADAELVFNTETVGSLTPGFYYWSTAIGSWVRIGDAVTPPPPSATGGWLLAGNNATATDFIGTTNNVDVAFKRGSNPAGKIGTKNTSYGLGALGNGNSGDENTAIGSGALGSINSAGARFNTAVGYNALSVTSNVTNCVAIGANALLQNTAIKNTAVGWNALQGNISEEGNTAIGAEALNNNGGPANTAIGFQAGFVSGNNNTMIGYEAGETTPGNNNIIIGHQTAVTGNSKLNIGNWIFGDNGDIGIGVAAPAAKLEVDGKIKAVDVNFSGLPEFANEAACDAANLAVPGTIASGDLYQTATGEIRIRL